MTPLRSSPNGLDSLIKTVSSATVKFSNDKILKASGFLRDAEQLLRRGDKVGQEDFTKLFAALEVVKTDRSSVPFANHMEAIWAMIPAFAVNLLPKDVSPSDHLSTCKESTQYYLNRILKEAKEKNDERSIEWVNAMNGLLTGLLSNCPSSTPATVREVEEDQVVVVEQHMEQTKIESENDLLTLEGNRWYIRKGVNLPEPVVITPETHSQALAIEDSKKIAIKVDGKINAVLADQCTQLDLEVGDVVSAMELLGCSRVRLFLNGEAHVIVLDDCEAVQIYLSAASKNVKVLTSKCAEINILAPAGVLDASLEGKEEAEDYVEMAIPVQFASQIGPHGKLITEPHEHVGV